MLIIHGGGCSNCFFNSPNQWAPLHQAALGDHVDTVRCLVDKGADINLKDIRGVSKCESMVDCISNAG